MNHNVGYGSRNAYWNFDQRGTVFINYLDRQATSGGSLRFYLDYLGPVTPSNLRSFWTIYASGAASTDITGTASASSSPSRRTAQAYGTASSSGNKVVQLTGTSGNLEISFSGQAFQPKEYDGQPIAQLSGSLQYHPHPVFSLPASEPGNKSKTGPNVRDGSQNGRLDIGVVWHTMSMENPFPTGWYASEPYQFSQDLYSDPNIEVTGSANQGWIGDGSKWGYGEIFPRLGSDYTSSALGITHNVVAKLKDNVYADNASVTINTDITWHKPIENPVLLPTGNYVVGRTCQITDKQPQGAQPPLSTVSS